MLQKFVVKLLGEPRRKWKICCMWIGFKWLWI